MNTASVLQTADSLLAGWAIEMQRPEENRLDVFVDANNLITAVTAITTAKWGYLASITGLDLGAANNQMEVLYHFCAGAAVLTLRVRVDRQQASVPSICEVFPSASFFERELREMLGVEVVGLVNRDYLFLPDDWPTGVYPLRKDEKS
ncbi:MAG: NADH-quinone oxidoreductase subunit C [Anaerolineae bacterium]